MKTPIIEITGATVLQIGGCRITVEPAASPTSTTVQTDTREPTTGDWRVAEAELQGKTNMPFEPPSVCRAERLALSPRVGGKFRAVSGMDAEIARVIGQDGALWFIVDTRGRPVALKRIDFKWHALPPSDIPPVPGDVIVHHGAESLVAAVVGEAEIGGWAVSNDRGVPLHVIRGEKNRWMSLGSFEVENPVAG